MSIVVYAKRGERNRDDGNRKEKGPSDEDSPRLLKKGDIKCEKGLLCFVGPWVNGLVPEHPTRKGGIG